jgi:Ca2+-binding EF-hand superfamily protein
MAPAAAPAAGAQGDLFARLDRNGDGKIDQSEWQGLQQFRFQRLDADHNGSLSAAEMQEQGSKAGRGGDRLARLDTNSDGVITEQEFVTGQMAVMGRLDADQDGAISRAEFDRVAGAMAGRT